MTMVLIMIMILIMMNKFRKKIKSDNDEKIFKKMF